MLKLTERYSDRPEGELPLLFQRILQNGITDHFRRTKVRSSWMRSFSSFFSKDDEDGDHDPMEFLDSLTEHSDKDLPENQLSRSQILSEIESALENLPSRQREAFLLRYWEEMDVAETASIMGCSEGSVKTHCSRAVHALATALAARGLKL
jgi:RNA polymerase sigma-70 factor (ECF subfamily)